MAKNNNGANLGFERELWQAADALRSNQSGEGEIRKNIIEADLVDCMVALPGQLFYLTQIPVCLWFVARDKKNGPCLRRAGRGRQAFPRATGAAKRSSSTRGSSAR